jgi:hypothetical protein
MYELPDFGGIERDIHWGMPQGDPLYIICGAIVMLVFWTGFFYYGYRVTRWLFT